MLPSSVEQNQIGMLSADVLRVPTECGRGTLGWASLPQSQS